MVQGVEDAPFYEEEKNSDDESGGEEEEESDKKDAKPKKPHYVMDSDHRLLLKNCKPLLQSRNAAVCWLWWCSCNACGDVHVMLVVVFM